MAGISVLVVEDEPNLRGLIADQLTYRGASVVAASDGRKAWTLLQGQKFDVVLSDIRMPGGDGIELIKNIFNNMVQKPAVFLCTGFSDLTVEEAKEYGVIEVFEKPFEMKSVVKIIMQTVAPSASPKVI